ncbi:MAG: hypothetical protein Q8Q25_00330 [bacterium]|nr:hypothetical protein [bacterium]
MRVVLPFILLLSTSPLFSMLRVMPRCVQQLLLQRQLPSLAKPTLFSRFNSGSAGSKEQEFQCPEQRRITSLEERLKRLEKIVKTEGSMIHDEQDLTMEIMREANLADQRARLFWGRGIFR